MDSAPPVLQDWQERARTLWQTATLHVKEKTSVARQAANDRVNVAKAGKQLLDEGGETAAQALLAKRASIDASDIDRNIASRVQAGFPFFLEALLQAKIIDRVTLVPVKIDRNDHKQEPHGSPRADTKA